MSADLFDRYASLDPANSLQAAPDWASTSHVLLAAIDERMIAMNTQDTLERTEIERTKGDRLVKRDRWLTVAVTALIVAFVGLGSLLIFDSEPDAGADLTLVQEQMLETIDAYMDAWNTGDGAAATAFMVPSGYHQTGTMKYSVAEGGLERYIETIGPSFSVSRTDAAFVGAYVMTTDHIPADSDIDRPSIYWMSTDGTRILWHLVP